MAVHITMPKWGMSMKEGKVTKWLKSEGDSIQKGEPLFEVETEKITNQVEATADGVLYQMVVQTGTVVPVGAIVAVIAEPGEEPERMAGAQIDEVNEKEPPEAQPPTTSEREERKEKKFVVATPSARRVAKELGIDLANILGSGPDGRVTEADVKKFHQEGPPSPPITPLAEEMAKQAGLVISAITGTGDGGKIIAGDVEKILSKQVSAEPVQSIPFTGMRKSIADNMHASLMNTAQLTAFTDVDVTELVKFIGLVRREYAHDETVKISLNDTIVLATSRALKQFPIMNSTLVDNEILLHNNVNMGIAVALAEGLIVPVLKDADKKGLLQIAKETRELVRKARKGSISVDDVTDGTFTITNLSMFGVDGFTPILRPPETGILGVCRVKSKPSVYNGNIAIRSMMMLCLTFDHRVVDGAPASEFLQKVARFLEEPTFIIM